MDIREYFQKEQKGFYKIIEENLTTERRKQLYDAINEWHERELKLLGIADVGGSVMITEEITEETILELGFVKHSEYTYKMFMNNVHGYLDEIEVFFEPNEEICITIRQKRCNTLYLDVNSIFIRNMKKLYELRYLVAVLTGRELTGI